MGFNLKLNRVCPHGSFIRFFTMEMLKIVAIVLAIVSFGGLFIFVGHITEMWIPDHTSPHHSSNSNKAYSNTEHYIVELFIGAVICLVGAMFIGTVVALMWILYHEMIQWYQKWKRDEEELIVNVDIPRSEYQLLKRGSIPKFLALIGAWILGN